MRMLVLALVIGVALLGCGSKRPGVPAPTAPFAAGSRLRVQTLVEPGGLQLFEAFFDPELGFNCLPQVADDGDPLQCLPISSVATLYADGGCSQPLLQDELATQTFLIGPPTVLKFFRRGDSYPAGSPVYGQAYSGAPCIPRDAPGPLVLGVEVPLESMVGFTKKREGAGRIQAQVDVGDDGSKVASSFYDPSLDTECYPLTAGDGVLRCLPTASWAWVGGAFADPRCTTPAAEDDSGTATFAMVGKDPAGCDARYEIHRLGKLLSTGYRPTDGGNCRAIPFAAGARYFELGGVVDLEEVRQGTTGQGRVVLDTLNSGGASLDVGFHDRTFDSSCNALLDPSGVLRCAPPVEPITGYFKDPSCTQAATGGRPPECTKVALLRSDDGLLHRTGPSFAAYSTTLGSCMTVPPSVYGVGESMSWADLVTLERRRN